MKKRFNLEQIGLFELSYYNLIDNLGLNESFKEDNLIRNNNSLLAGKKESDKKTSLFDKENEEKDEKDEKLTKTENKIKEIQKKIISNVDFKPDNTKERGSGTSNNTYGLLSSKKFSFDYSSKSGSKDGSSIKESIKEIENEESLQIVCLTFVDTIFNLCMEDIKRKKKSFSNEISI